jgi:ketosteroid isomerase-like protein
VNETSSLTNLEVVQLAYEEFRETGEMTERFTHPDFVWDMSHYSGWPEQQTYHGIEGATRFMTEWRDAWDEWVWEVRSMHSAHDKVVAIVYQAGRSKSTGVRVEMNFAQVFTVKNGRQTRMEVYSDLDEALAAAGVTP